MHTAAGEADIREPDLSETSTLIVLMTGREDLSATTAAQDLSRPDAHSTTRKKRLRQNSITFSQTVLQ